MKMQTVLNMMFTKMIPAKVLIAGLLLFILLLAYCIVEPYLLTVHSIEYINGDIPDGFDGKRIVFVSDIHHGPFFSIKRVRKTVAMINSLHPDIVLLGGDYVHRNRRYIKPVFSELAYIRSGLFTGGVLGNHDHWESASMTLKAMNTAGISILDNNAFWVGEESSRIRIGGVGDMFENIQNTGITLEGVLDSDFVIVVSHNPDYFSSLSDRRVDLVLSGHTHGGQVTFFGLWAPLMPIKDRSHWKGFYKGKQTDLFITTGVGTITPPVRFFARPEIVEILLKKQ